MSVFLQTQLLDSHELLSTKLALPRLKSPWVPRQRLLARLDAGLERKLTLISAPAGFGKTTLVAEWIESTKSKGDRLTDSQPASISSPGLPQARQIAQVDGQAPRLPDVRQGRRQEPATLFAWVSLDFGDNDPVRFWRYVLAACQTFGEGVGSSALAILHASQEPPFEAMLTRLINDLAQLPGKVVLILEDFHLINSQQVHETLAFLLEHLPEALHLVVLTRTDPPLPLARLRARDDLAELRAADLRFSPEEVATFIRQAIPYPFPEEAVARLAERTEGWAAGMRLVALTFQGRQEPAEVEQFLDTFAGAHRPVLEYLVLEVLGAQSEPLQEFLLQTSFFSRLNASLCDAVTGRGDSAAILEQIERANLFLVPLDAAGEWYRYHSLFAEAMQHVARERFEEERLCELYHRACLWYEGHGLLAEAVEAALSAQEYPHAGDLIERIIAPQLVQNEHHTLRCWIEQLPKQVLFNYPTLCFTYATAVLFTSDRRAPETHARLKEPLNVAEAAWREADDRLKLGELFAFRSVAAWVLGDTAQAISAASQALELLPEDEMQWRGISLISVGAGELLAGKLHAAQQTLTEARSRCMAAGNAYGSLDSTNMLGRTCALQGELQQAVQLFRWVLSELDQVPMEKIQASLRKGRALTGLASLAFERNDLESAGEQLSQALALAQEIADVDLRVRASLVLARLLHARQDTAQARELLGKLAAETQLPALLGEVLAVQAWLSLASGDLASAQHWHSTRSNLDNLPLIQREQEDLISAHLLIAQGQAAEALHLLDALVSSADEGGRLRNGLEARTLMALACSALDDQPQARHVLVQTIEMAQPGGYKRLFLDQGEALQVLMLDCRSEIAESGSAQLLDYTDSLLEAFESKAGVDRLPASDQTTPKGVAHKVISPVEALSEREERVFELLAAGLTNPEIAQELIISVNTVKTHIKSIYRKLDVTSRKEVRQAAHRLNLI